MTSPPDEKYNCVAWAVGFTELWWWPDQMEQSYWPPGAPRRVTVEDFTEVFRALGYTPCADDRPEPGFEKVALFAKEGIPTHAARELPNGTWTSKLGPGEDIEHVLEALVGDQYGDVVAVLRLRRVDGGQT